MIYLRQGLTAEADHSVCDDPARTDYRKYTVIEIVGLDSHNNPIWLRLSAREVDEITALLP